MSNLEFSLSKETAIPPMTCLSKHILTVLITLFWLLPAWAQQHGQGHSERRGPSDVQQYIESLERGDRDKDQKPEEVIKALQLTEYMTIADIGAGSGYFTRKFVWAVQDKGMVYAVDIEPAMLKYNEEMVEHLHTPYNAKFMLAKPEDPMLPPASVGRRELPRLRRGGVCCSGNCVDRGDGRAHGDTSGREA